MLTDSERQIKSGEYKDAVLSIGKEWYEHEQVATNIKSKQGYNLVKSSPLRTDYTIGYRYSSGGRDLDSNLKSCFQDVAKDVDQVKKDIRNIIKIQILNVDPRKYLAFKDIMPHVSKLQTWENNKAFYEFYIPDADNINNTTYSYDQIKFCFDFVVDSIFNFQDKF